MITSFSVAGVGALVWFHAARPKAPAPERPRVNPLATSTLTAWQRASIKYFGVAAALFVTQIGMGALTAPPRRRRLSVLLWLLSVLRGCARYTPIRTLLSSCQAATEVGDGVA